MNKDMYKISMKLCKTIFIGGLCWGFAPSLIGRAYQENLPYYAMTLYGFAFFVMDFFMAKIFDNTKIKRKVFYNYKLLVLAMTFGDLISLVIFIITHNLVQLLIIDALIDGFNNAEGYMFEEVNAAWFNGNDRTEHSRRRSRYHSTSQIIARCISILIAFFIIGNTPITMTTVIVIECVMCVMNIVCEVLYYRIYKQSIHKVEEMWKELDMKNASKELKSREFLMRVKKLSEEYKVPFFCVTDGASMTCNQDCDAITHARLAHVDWERQHGFDPDEDWSKSAE